MRKLILLTAGAAALSGCLGAVYGDGEQIGVRQGKALFGAQCTVDLSTAGKQGLFGTGTIPLYGGCDVAATNRCGENNYTIHDVERWNRRMQTDVFQNGPSITRRTYVAESVRIQFTCDAPPTST